jgi:hypothetical protein
MMQTSDKPTRRICPITIPSVDPNFCEATYALALYTKGTENNSKAVAMKKINQSIFPGISVIFIAAPFQDHE